MSVVVGATDLTDFGQRSHNAIDAQRFGIKRVTAHSEFGYLYPNFENDILLLELQSEINWTPNAQPACILAQVDEKAEPDIPAASIAGWGLRKEGQKCS
jgi:hypothetical protein